jgi:UDP-glucuronate 4-epimerase
MPETILITGVAGFIGFHLARQLATLRPQARLVGFDNLNPYYDVRLKEARLRELLPHSNFIFHRIDLTDKAAIDALFADTRPDVVLHMAAQAGVRYSLESPQSYIDSNITGFLNILEACRAQPPRHLIYASSSSVYGLNTTTPFRESHKADSPASLYGATKKANEEMAHAYAHLFGIRATGLRFFTVYGPWGRPDMAFFKFTHGILAGDPIPVYNQGAMLRDFTFVDDVVQGIVRLIDAPPGGTPPHAVYNIGAGQPVNLLDCVQALEEALGRKAILDLQPLQPGDVRATHADTSALRAAVGYAPETPLSEGVKAFVGWYRQYHQI